ncbi:hypothetical protein H0H93_004128 [Arthromyces matolae]|nr:hypothetical protein H0H93_004128 [Arthromyces matolae]
MCVIGNFALSSAVFPHEKEKVLLRSAHVPNGSGKCGTEVAMLGGLRGLREQALQKQEDYVKLHKKKSRKWAAPLTLATTPSSRPRHDLPIHMLPSRFG